MARGQKRAAELLEKSHDCFDASFIEDELCDVKKEGADKMCASICGAACNIIHFLPPPYTQPLV